MPSSIPQAEADGVAIDCYTGRVVIEPIMRVSTGGLGVSKQDAARRGPTYTVGMYSPGKAFVV